MVTGYKKNGDYDLRTKKGQELKKQSDASNVWVMRHIIVPLLLLALLFLILECIFPGINDKIDNLLHLN
ncbi:MAG: hypothetical protein IKU85_05825 [Bacteroidaceae bacterium]|nr:hypothetical protein [Bacteroidaceae bacterium]